MLLPRLSGAFAGFQTKLFEKKLESAECRNLMHSSTITNCVDGMIWYGILWFNVPLDTVQVISEQQSAPPTQ